MHQIRLRLGLCPSFRWGAYSAPADLLAGFKGSTSKGREGRKDGRGGAREGRGPASQRGRGEGREERGKEG